MAWIALTVANVKSRMVGAEITALATVGLAAGSSNPTILAQTDPTQDIINKVVLELRGRLRNRTELETGQVIPDNWEHHCLAVIRFRLVTRVPGFPWSPIRQREYDDAMEAFKQLGPILPDEPTVPDGTGEYFPAPTSTVPVPRFTRENQDGL